MPEFVSPGVYVEETSFSAKSIEGVDTSTAAFVGPTLSGPAGSVPALLTSYSEFERTYGTCGDLALGSAPLLNRNYVAHAARAFFDNGGTQLYVASTPAHGVSLPGPGDYAVALDTLKELRDVSTVAFPGYSACWATDAARYSAIQQVLLAHVEQASLYRFAVLDAPLGVTSSKIEEIRSALNSKFAALYYPWITVKNPQAGAVGSQPANINLPPSGFVCGIYARVDRERGVAKAPANVDVRGAVDLEAPISQKLQDTLNPAGVNCFRIFPGRGTLLWGARTLSADAEWKYVNVRRYVTFLERSIDRGTQWAVFEPNGAALWATLRQTVENFLYDQWRCGALQGAKPEHAYFVRCDRTTMTQNDIDTGRVICEFGVAVLKPAEFVIIRIGQSTADARH